MRTQIGIAVRLLLDDRPDPVVLARIGSNIGEDAQLGDVGIVFRIEAFELGMDGSVAGSRQASVALVDLGVGTTTLLEVRVVVFAGDRLGIALAISLICGVNPSC